MYNSKQNDIGYYNKTRRTTLVENVSHHGKFYGCCSVDRKLFSIQKKFNQEIIRFSIFSDCYCNTSLPDLSASLDDSDFITITIMQSLRFAFRDSVIVSNAIRI